MKETKGPIKSNFDKTGQPHKQESISLWLKTYNMTKKTVPHQQEYHCEKVCLDLKLPVAFLVPPVLKIEQMCFLEPIKATIVRRLAQD